MNEELVRVTSVKLKVGGKELELTVDELRKLRTALEELLGSVPAQPVIIPTHPWPWYGEPIWVNPNVEPWPNRWEITCGPLQQSACLTINA